MTGLAPDIEFVVHGTPAPKGSKRAFPHRTTGRVVMTDSNPVGLRDWTRQVNDVVQGLARESEGPLDEPLRAEVTFYMPRPASRQLRSRIYPTVKPDLDKLQRALWDVLVRCRLIVDDSRFVEVLARKEYADDGLPRAEVRIWGLGQPYVKRQRHIAPENDRRKQRAAS